MSEKFVASNGPDPEDDGFWVDPESGVWYSHREKTEVFYGPEAGDES